MLLLPFSVFAQGTGKRTVTGLVIDNSGEPVYGAVVVEDGTQNAVTVGADGAYSIVVKDDANTVLYVSFIGMTAQKVKIENKYKIDFELKPDQVLESAEVVATGYGDVAKDAYTGSATVVNASDIANRPAGTIEGILGGLSPGLLSSGSGQPGDKMEVNLRGFGSIDGSSNPIYVVDGVVLDQDNMSGHSNAISTPLATLNPADIENVTILKDAASASLYGAQGANGVIVITTKQGKQSDKVRYSFSAQAGISHAAKFVMPELVSSTQFRDLWTEGELHRLVSSNDDRFFLYADKLNNRIDGKNFYQWQKEARANFNAMFAIPKPDGTYYNYDFFAADEDKLPNTNWYDLITRNAVYQKYDFSLQGGLNSIKYYMSFGYMDQEGVIINSNLERLSYKLQLKYDDPKKFFNWGVTANVSRTNQNGPLTSGTAYNMPHYAALLLPSVVPAYLEDGSYNFKFPNNLLNGNHNPVASAHDNIKNRPQFTLQSTAWVKLNIAKWLNFRADVNEYYITGHRTDYFDKDFGTGYLSDGQLVEYDSKRIKMTAKGMFNLNLTFKDRHRINATAGVEAVDFAQTYNSMTVSNFIDDSKPVLSTGTVATSWTGSGYDYSTFSIISRADYSYRYRYFLGASFRQDRSSRFAPEYRTGNFWSVSGAWRITNEPWMKPLRKVFDNVKFKGSYGYNGTVPNKYYQWRTLYSGSGSYDESQALSQSFRPTYDLTWEKNRIWNVGVDVAMLGNRLKFTAEYYERKSYDLIQEVPVSETTGYSSILTNTTAGIYNRGFELDLNASVLSIGSFKWDLGFNMATLKATYYGLEQDIIGGGQIKRNGESVYAWYMYDYAGVNPNTGAVTYWAYDKLGNKVHSTSENPSHRMIVGKGVPTVTGAINTNFSFMGFALSAVMTYGLGHQVLDTRASSRTAIDGKTITYNMDVRQLDAWTPDNLYATQPVRVNGKSGSGTSTRFLFDGDYLKFKNVALSYTFPARTFRKIGVSGATVFAQVENLHVFTELDGYDPDLQSNSIISVAKYPSATTYTAGLRFNF